MSLGKNIVTPFGVPGIVGASDVPDWSFLYTVSTIKDPKYNIGDRVVTGDGRVFRYAQAGLLGVVPELGAGQLRKSAANAVAPAQATAAELGQALAAGVVGSRFVSVTIASAFGHAATGVITKDELRGGYIVIGNGTSQHPQMRQIVGNPALAAAGILTVQLDAGLTTAVTVGTTNIELIMNPYAHLSIGAGDSLTEFSSIMGIPVISATHGQYFWLQTWGPCWITSAGSTCDAANDRTLWFEKSGLVVSGEDVTVESGFQKAGFAIDASSVGASNAPFVMLQISI